MSEEIPVYGPFFGYIGASLSMMLCACGTAYATAKSGTAIASAAVENPGAIMKTLLPVVMGGILCIYGLVASILISNAIVSSAEGYTVSKGFIHLGSGIAVGMTGLAAGYAIGEVGASGVRTTIYQPNYFVGMILILIFAEVIGLYGLIISLILSTK